MLRLVMAATLECGTEVLHGMSTTAREDVAKDRWTRTCHLLECSLMLPNTYLSEFGRTSLLPTTAFHIRHNRSHTFSKLRLQRGKPCLAKINVRLTE